MSCRNIAAASSRRDVEIAAASSRRVVEIAAASSSRALSVLSESALLLFLSGPRQKKGAMQQLDPVPSTPPLEETFALEPAVPLHEISDRKAGTKELTEDAQKPYRCDMCGKGFTSRPGLKYHASKVCVREPAFAEIEAVEAVKNEKPYHCDMCGKGFVSLPGLKYHNIRVCIKDPTQVPPEREYRCDVCGKSFTSGPGLKYHATKVCIKEPGVLEYDKKRATSESMQEDKDPMVLIDVNADARVFLEDPNGGDTSVPVKKRVKK